MALRAFTSLCTHPCHCVQIAFLFRTRSRRLLNRQLPAPPPGAGTTLHLCVPALGGWGILLVASPSVGSLMHGSFQFASSALIGVGADVRIAFLPKAE